MTRAEAPRKISGPGQKFRLGPLVSGAPKSRDEQNKVIASADVRISVQNQVTSKKRVIASADVQISAQHLVISKKKVIASANVRILAQHLVISNKKVIPSADVRLSARNQKNFIASAGHSLS